jgi:peptidoglycan/LPS O-acetylase OafA/YrhL
MIQGRELSDKEFQIDSLDGLRGLAVLIVFLSHTSLGGTYLFPFANLSGIGKSGVYLFFVLSSFLLTLPFVRKGEAAKSRRFLLNYSLRRFFRIYPLYFCYLLLGLITTLVLWKIIGSEKPVGIPFTLPFNSFIRHLLLIQGEGVTWSIPVEFHYYFILPVLALTYSVLLKNNLLLSAALTVLLVGVSQYFWPESEALANDIRLRPYLSIFFMGSLLAVIFHKWQENSLSRNRKIALAVELSGIGAIITLICMTPSVFGYIAGKEVPFDFFHKQFLLTGFLWSVVVFSCIAGIGIMRRIFEHPFLRYLGFISFSVYLLHVIAVAVVERAAPEVPMRGWIMLALTIAISHVSWALIEKPTSKIRVTKGR